MSEIDAKVNMSLDEIIKMEKKEKKKKTGTTSGKPGAKRTRGSTVRGRSTIRARGTRLKRNTSIVKKEQTWQRAQPTSSSVRGGFIRKRYKKTAGLTRSRSNLSLNQKPTVRGAFNVRRGRGGKFGLTRSRSRTNLTFTQAGFFTSNKTTLKRTSSLPNLRDPTSVHNRLGYQSPAQIAYRNRVKRAKQLLLQRQNQRLTLQNQFRMPQATKPLLSLQQRPMERRQQILTSQRRFTTGGLRSDQIARAQRRAQYEQKLMRLNSPRVNNNSNVNFMCTMGTEYSSNAVHQRPMPLSQSHHNGGSIISCIRQMHRGRSPFRQSMQSSNVVGRSSGLFARQRSRSRSRSRSRTRNTSSSEAGPDVDDRTFSEVMYSLSGNLGVTGRTLNDRFSF